MCNSLVRRSIVLLFLVFPALHAVLGISEGGEAPRQKGPMLFFKQGDIPGLKQKIENPEYASIWKVILDKAQRDCDPSSKDYADPAIYQKLESGKGVGMSYARHLSDWMGEIGFAYQMTQNEAFGRHGAALLEVAAHNVTVDSKAMVGEFAGANGDMMRALAIGLDFFSDAMTPQQRTGVVETAHNYLLHHIKEYDTPDGLWHTNLMPHNFNGVCGGAIGMLAIALRNDFPKEAPDWIKLGEKMSTDWIAAGFDRQGAYFEGVLYMNYGLGNVLIFGDALRRYLGCTTIIENQTIQKIPFYLAMEKLPGEPAFDARNDSLYSVDMGGGGGGGCPFLLLMASGYGGATAENPLAAWLWRNAGPKRYNLFLQIAWGGKAAGRDPSQLLSKPYGAYFPDRGLCIWRTGWNRDDVMFSIEAGPYHPITHNQADKGHFNLYGLGYRWAADPGYGNNQEPKGRAQTVAHSCVLVDGKGQALSGAALGTDGKVLLQANNPRYGYALVDCKSAYNHNSAGRAGVPLGKALRHAFFIRPDGKVPAYSLILDDMEWDKKPHQFSWQMITWADMKVQVDGTNTFLLQPGTAPNGPKMKLILNASAPLTLSEELYTPDQHPGRAPNVFRRLRGVATTLNPHFVAVLAPLPAGAPEPVLAVEETSNGRLIKIDWGSRVDMISWSGDEAKLLD